MLTADAVHYSVMLIISVGTEGVRLAFVVVIGLLLGVLLGVALYDRFSALPEIGRLTEAPPRAALTDPEVQARAAIDQFSPLAQSIADMQLLYQTQSLRLQQLESRLRQVEAAQLSLSTAQSSSIRAVSDGSSASSLGLDEEAAGAGLNSLPDTATDVSDSAVGWFVHIGHRATPEEAEALAFAVTESLGFAPAVMPSQEGVYLVRICQLPTQVRAQETVQMLRRNSDGESLWIGRGCEPN